LLPVPAVAWRQGNADADAHVHPMVVQLVGLTDSSDHPVGQRRGVLLANDSLDATGHREQQLITSRMPKRIVDNLELVEIEAQSL